MRQFKDKTLDAPGMARMPGLWSYEREAWRSGYRLVAGIDEAGRGPLAGPVVAAAVILPSDFDPSGINDSKLLTEEERGRAYARIICGCHAYGVGVVDSEVIDRINIRNATQLAMEMAIAEMMLKPEVCLIDGSPLYGFPHLHKTIIKGDCLSVSIASASIIAKVTRDRIMLNLDDQYPGYGFAKHKGYATIEHLAAISELGACPEHRMTFRPLATVPSSPQCLLFDSNAR